MTAQEGHSAGGPEQSLHQPSLDNELQEELEAERQAQLRHRQWFAEFVSYAEYRRSQQLRADSDPKAPAVEQMAKILAENAKNNFDELEKSVQTLTSSFREKINNFINSENLSEQLLAERSLRPAAQADQDPVRLALSQLYGEQGLLEERLEQSPRTAGDGIEEWNIALPSGAVIVERQNPADGTVAVHLELSK